MQSICDLGRRPRVNDLDVPHPLTQGGVVWSVRPCDSFQVGRADAGLRYHDPGDVLELLSDAIGPPTGVCVLDDTVVGAAGWAELGFAEQYEAVTDRAVAFVAGAMRYLRVRGPDAAAALDLLTPTDILSLGVGRAALAFFTTPAGTVDNEAVVVRVAADELLLSCGGPTHDPSWLPEALAEHPDATVEPADIGCFNVKGPARVRALCELLDIRDRPHVSRLKPFDARAARTVEGHEAWIVKTVVGIELWGEGEALRECWVSILGMPELVVPGSWDLLDVFRLECDRFTFGVYPIDLHGGTTLWEAGQDRFAAPRKTRDFIGREALARSRGRRRFRLTGLVAGGTDRSVPALGEEVRHAGGAFAGYVTTAAWSPRFGRPVAFGHLRADVDDGAWLEIGGESWESAPLPLGLSLGGRELDRALDA